MNEVARTQYSLENQLKTLDTYLFVSFWSPFSYLFFADDLIIFYQAEESQAWILRRVLNNFLSILVIE